eukprot:6195409-Pleurochrysis_carterae.AAC.3
MPHHTGSHYAHKPGRRAKFAPATAQTRASHLKAQGQAKGRCRLATGPCPMALRVSPSTNSSQPESLPRASSGQVEATVYVVKKTRVPIARRFAATGRQSPRKSAFVARLCHVVLLKATIEGH